MQRRSLRAVFDTNIVVSALVFSGRLSWLRSAWTEGTLVPVVCPESVRELLRVLSYPKFKLSARDRAALLQEYLLPADIVVLTDAEPSPHACRDPHDAIFLTLARHANVALITGDDDLLTLRDVSTVRIMSAAELHDLLPSL